MQRLTEEQLELVLAAMRGSSRDDQFEAERLAFAITHHCPEVAELIIELSKEKRAPAAFPAIGDITAAQCSIWDNWPGGNRPSRKKGEKGARSERYKAVFEFWTIAPPRVEPGSKARPLTLTKRNAAFVATVHLMDGPALAAKVNELRSPSKTLRPFHARGGWDEDGLVLERYGDMLAGMANEHMDGFRAGPLFTTNAGAGTYFHANLFAVTTEAGLDARDRDLSVTLDSPGGQFVFDKFVATYPDGSPLSGNLILTSRMTDIEQKRAWTSAAQWAA